MKTSEVAAATEEAIAMMIPSFDESVKKHKDHPLLTRNRKL